MKKVLIVWAFVAVFLVCGLTVIGLYIKKENAPYRALEKKLKEQAMALVGEKPNYIKETNKLTLEDFSNNNYEIDMTVSSDKCEGYVIIKNTMGILDYKPYIKCPKYQTHGYQK